jgi:hypothetical protein
MLTNKLGRTMTTSELVARIEASFGASERWSGEYLHAPGCVAHDECEWLQRVLCEKTWMQVNPTELLSIYFHPSTFLTARGMKFMLPVLFKGGLLFPDSMMSYYALDALESTSVPQLLSDEERKATCEWLVAVNGRDEYGEPQGSSAVLMAKLKQHWNLQGHTWPR